MTSAHSNKHVILDGYYSIKAFDMIELSGIFDND